MATNSTERPKPVFGIVCVALSAAAILVPLVVGPELGGEIDPHLCYLVPLVVVVLAVLAFIRRERVIWPIIGIVLTAFYIGLHLIARP
jgi:hypothetical protein